METDGTFTNLKRKLPVPQSTPIKPPKRLNISEFLIAPDGTMTRKSESNLDKENLIAGDVLLKNWKNKNCQKSSKVDETMSPVVMLSPLKPGKVSEWLRQNADLSRNQKSPKNEKSKNKKSKKEKSKYFGVKRKLPVAPETPESFDDENPTPPKKQKISTNKEKDQTLEREENTTHLSKKTGKQNFA